MIEGQQKPLEIAARVLKLETLQALAKAPFNLRGWKIVDRWAMNSPAKLKELEAQGQIVILGRVLEQQQLETEALENREEMMHLAEHEILEMNEIQTELT